ncbi:uncharacterized protein [Clytia hemisphaerica]
MEENEFIEPPSTSSSEQTSSSLKNYGSKDEESEEEEEESYADEDDEESEDEEDEDDFADDKASEDQEDKEERKLPPPNKGTDLSTDAVGDVGGDTTPQPPQPPVATTLPPSPVLVQPQPVSTPPPQPVILQPVAATAPPKVVLVAKTTLPPPPRPPPVEVTPPPPMKIQPTKSTKPPVKGGMHAGRITTPPPGMEEEPINTTPPPEELDNPPSPVKTQGGALGKQPGNTTPLPIEKKPQPIVTPRPKQQAPAVTPPLKPIAPVVTPPPVVRLQPVATQPPTPAMIANNQNQGPAVNNNQNQAQGNLPASSNSNSAPEDVQSYNGHSNKASSGLEQSGRASNLNQEQETADPLQDLSVLGGPASAPGEKAPSKTNNAKNKNKKPTFSKKKEEKKGGAKAKEEEGTHKRGGGYIKYKAYQTRPRYNKGLVKIGGKLVRVTCVSKTSKTETMAGGTVNLKRLLMKYWDWRRLIRGFQFEAIKKTSIAFLVDGHIKKHIPMMQHWIYNLAMLFQKGSFISVSMFAENVFKVADFRTYSSAKEVRDMLSAGIRTSGGRPRKVGEGLEYYYNAFKKNGQKGGVLFVFLNGPNDKDDLSKAASFKAKFKSLGVRVVTFGLGRGGRVQDLMRFTYSRYVYTARGYRGVILGGKGLRIAGRPTRGSVFSILRRYLGRYFGRKIGISSSAVSKFIQREWWYRQWGWYRYLGLRYGSIGRANLAFLIDATDSSKIAFIQRYVYNYVRMFQLQGTYVTFITYGASVNVVTKWVTFSGAQDVQKACSAISFIASKDGKRDTAAAFQKLLKIYPAFLRSGRSGKNPNLVFLLLTGRSSTQIGSGLRSRFLAMFGAIRGIGSINLWGVGLSIERSSYSELSSFVTQRGFLITGGLKGLSSKSVFNIMQQNSMKLTGSGSSMTYITGRNGGGKRQAWIRKWSWRKGSGAKIRYGVIGRANIAFLIDGTVAVDFGAVRRFIYNIIRLFSLSDTSININVYGSQVYRVCNFEQFRNGDEIKDVLRKMPKVLNGVRNTGAALKSILSDFSEAPTGKPNLLFTILQGSSKDDVVNVAADIRRFGIKTFAIGIGKTYSRKELALIAYSCSMIFQTNTNGLSMVIQHIQANLRGIVGSVSRATGRKGHTKARDSDIIRTWQWKSYGYRIRYGYIQRVSILILLDGTNRQHFDILEKLCFNVYRMFGAGSYISVVTYGATQDKTLSEFRTYADGTALQNALSGLSYKGPSGSKIGAALTYASRLVMKAPRVGRKICFLVATQPSEDPVAEPAKTLVKSGVSVFAIGIGARMKSSELRQISSYFLVSRWQTLLRSVMKIQNTMIKVIGRNPSATKEIGVQPPAGQGEQSKKPPLPVPQASFISSSTVQTTSDVQSKWNWWSMTSGVKPSTLGMSNVAILLDVSKEATHPIMLRFVAQIISMFRFSAGTTFTVISYATTPKMEFAFKSFVTQQEVITALKAVQPNPVGRVRTGACLKFFKQRLINRFISDNKRTPLMFLVTQSKSSDDISKISQQIKGSGCKAIGIGVGGSYSQEEINMIGMTGQTSLSVSTPAELPTLMGRILFSLTTIVNGPPKSTIVSLTSLVGEQGSSLAASVMNSVMTGSVPSEAAGQPGQPNTGALCGDASGQDTGAGAAGTPEQGGATDAADEPPAATPGSPEAEPGLPGQPGKQDGPPGQSPTDLGSPGDSPVPGIDTPQPAPGGEKPGGGSTGAGGTDVSAGGGNAGATEAVQGMSKHDGGPGGPADGKMTTGDSNEPVDANGSPSQTHLQPNGIPALPTNPDGSPGTGGSKPDGSADQPQGGIETGPDGTPNLSPDGSPALNPGGSEVHRPTPAPQPAPSDTGRDGGGQTPVNGQQPQGPVTPGNPDGTSTVTNPDGSTTVSNPDGTPTKLDENGKVDTSATANLPKNADGTYNKQNDDGSQTILNPDGTPTQTNPDGTPSTGGGSPATDSRKPDMNPDGTTTQTQQDGTVSILNPDGTSTAIGEDGRPITGAHGAPTNPDGTVTVTNQDGTQTIKNPDGTPTKLNPDGSPATGDASSNDCGCNPPGTCTCVCNPKTKRCIRHQRASQRAFDARLEDKKTRAIKMALKSEERELKTIQNLLKDEVDNYIENSEVLKFSRDSIHQRNKV